jgi:hypothetical protein
MLQEEVIINALLHVIIDAEGGGGEPLSAGTADIPLDPSGKPGRIGPAFLIPPLRQGLLIVVDTGRIRTEGRSFHLFFL